MITAEQSEGWRGRSVVDAEGRDIGKLDEVYHALSGEPTRVRSGLMGRHQALVPLAGSSVTRDYLRVVYREDQVSAAGQIESAEHLDAQAVAAIGNAYGVSMPDSRAGYETSAEIEARRVAALEARRQADALQDDAHRLGGQASKARAKASDADASASGAEQEAALARDEADRARRDAEVAARAAAATPQP